MASSFLEKMHNATDHQEEIEKKVKLSLLRHVFKQTNMAMLASFLCGGVVFIGLSPSDNSLLLPWFFIFAIITLFRTLAAWRFKKEKKLETHYQKWRNIFIMGTILGGISWGLASLMLLPFANDIEKVLVILMLAGVTAGSVPLSAPLPFASISFLLLALLPLVWILATFEERIYLLFDFAVITYIFYTIIVAIKTYHLFKNAVQLKFVNDDLLKKLSKAKNQLEVTNNLLEGAATHDSLTHVANRSLFQSLLETEINKAKIKHGQFALFYLDLDHFKLMNDLYGHHIGDFILSTIIGRIIYKIESINHIGRMGGDEFTILIKNFENIESLKQYARELCDLVALPIEFNGIQLQTNSSIGISIYPQDGEDVELLLRIADKNMYFVKEHGGDGYKLNEIGP